MVPAAASLARAIQQTGWDVAVELDQKAPLGEFAVYLDEDLVFSRYQAQRLPDSTDILPLLKERLFPHGMS